MFRTNLAEHHMILHALDREQISHKETLFKNSLNKEKHLRKAKQIKKKSYDNVWHTPFFGNQILMGIKTYLYFCCFFEMDASSRSNIASFVVFWCFNKERDQTIFGWKSSEPYHLMKQKESEWRIHLYIASGLGQANWYFISKEGNNIQYCM